MAGLSKFIQGAMENINPELPVDDQAELLPYDKKWEFPRDKLELGECKAHPLLFNKVQLSSHGWVNPAPDLIHCKTVHVPGIKHVTSWLVRLAALPFQFLLSH